jgi:membrane protease YdiL (CAAX protease family)
LHEEEQRFVSSQPLTFVVIFLLADGTLSLATGFAVGALDPSAPAYAPAIGGELGALFFSLVVLMRLGWIRKVGFNGPREWRDLRVLWLPALEVGVILVLGLSLSFSMQAVGITALFAILVGVTEESIYRGVVLQSLLPKGVRTAVVLSAVAFFLAHIGNLIQGQTIAALEGVLANALYAFLFGIGVAGIRIRTNTMWPGVTIHALTDFASLLAVGFGTATVSSAAPNPARVVLEVGVAAILAGYGLFLLRKEKQVRGS